MPLGQLRECLRACTPWLCLWAVFIPTVLWWFTDGVSWASFAVGIVSGGLGGLAVWHESRLARGWLSAHGRTINL